MTRIVLDLGKFPGATPHVLRDTAKRHREGRTGGYNVTAPDFLDFIADQIEAQTKPARIPEPGLWGVVEASTDQWKQRHEYVRVRTDGYGDWTFSGGSVNWVGLIDPTLIREGIS